VQNSNKTASDIACEVSKTIKKTERAGACAKLKDGKSALKMHGKTV